MSARRLPSRGKEGMPSPQRPDTGKSTSSRNSVQSSPRSARLQPATRPSPRGELSASTQSSSLMSFIQSCEDRDSSSETEGEETRVAAPVSISEKTAEQLTLEELHRDTDKAIASIRSAAKHHSQQYQSLRSAASTTLDSVERSTKNLMRQLQEIEAATEEFSVSAKDGTG